MLIKRLLCYGDSNTWGYMPISGERYGIDIRWPAVMRGLLGEGYEVIEEGMNGRTTVFDDPEDEYRNGSKHIMTCLLTHKPLDLVIVMLGSNDLKKIFNVSPLKIANGMRSILDKILLSDCGKNNDPPKVLLVAPIHIGENIEETEMGEYFDVFSRNKSKELKIFYQQIAIEYGLDFINAAEFVEPSRKDALHMDADAHLKLADNIAKRVKAIIG